MTLIDALSALADMGAPVFETRDAAARLDLPARMPAPCSAGWRRLATWSGSAAGVWAFARRVDPMSLPGRLTAPLPSYVSLQSALYLHGMISQMPAVTYAVRWPGRCASSRRSGVVSVHHVAPAFFFGFEEAPGRRAR